MIYDLLKDLEYPTYTSSHENIQQPYVIIQDIRVTPLPYSEESRKYNEVEALIIIQDGKLSNKKCLVVTDKANSSLQKLAQKSATVSHLSITTETQNNKHNFSTHIKVNFIYIS